MHLYSRKQLRKRSSNCFRKRLMNIFISKILKDNLIYEMIMNRVKIVLRNLKMQAELTKYNFLMKLFGYGVINIIFLKIHFGD